jgi:hypothetical protein
MPEPTKSPISCIGCGAVSPPGADVCVGCGHRFAGPALDPAPPSSGNLSTPADRPRFAPARPADDPIYTWRPPPEQTCSESLMIGLGWIFMILVTGVASVIAFCTTCVAISVSTASIGLGMVVGLVASGVVVFGMLKFRRALLGDTGDRRRGKPR